MLLVGGILAAWATARLIAGPRAGFIAAVALTVCGPWFGTMFNHTKDIPFAAAMMGATYFLLRAVRDLPKPRLMHLLAFGVLLGGALGQRATGLLMLFYTLIAIAMHAPRPPSWRGAAHFTASSLLLLPTTIANFNAGKGPEWFQWIVTQFGHGRPLFLVFYVSMIVFFAFFYTAIVFNPTETAENLKKHGGFIPGIRPGERTAEYIDHVLSRITAVGAAYLAIVCLIPELLISYAAVPFYFGGTSLLIVVSVTMDTVAQIQGYLLAHQYEGLIKKSKLRGRRR